MYTFRRKQNFQHSSFKGYVATAVPRPWLHENDEMLKAIQIITITNTEVHVLLFFFEAEGVHGKG